jgi:hypothetical protein
MIVFVAGMPRSGSTFSTNVAREILCLRGSVHQEFSSSLAEVIASSGAVDHIVWKGHEADEAGLRLIELGAARVICTFRKPEDAIASSMSMFALSLDDGITVIRRWFEMFARLRRFALLIPYKQIDLYPWLAAWRIARHLDAGLSQWRAFPIAQRYSKRAVKELADRLAPDGPGIIKAGTSHYDKETLIHRRHVSDLRSRSGDELLGAERVAAIREALAPFVTSSGDIDWAKIGGFGRVGLG